MLEKLHIRNIGIIGDLEVDFTKGLNVLTGETGAGKSLIINSIALLCGSRFSKELIRNKMPSAQIEGIFFHHGKEIIISRQIFENGKNVCKIDGTIVTINDLKEFTKDIIEIHGQLDNAQILDEATHINYLDIYCNAEIKDIKNKYIKEYENYLKIDKKLKELYCDPILRQRQIELLKFQIQEIEGANIKLNEDDELLEKKILIKNSKQVLDNLNKAYQSLDISKSNLNIATNCLNKVIKYRQSFEKTNNKLSSIFYDIEEIYYELKDELQKINLSESQIDEVEDRICQINDLKRKYGNSISEILKYKDEIKIKLQQLENSEDKILELTNTKNKIENELCTYSKEITKIRKKFAIDFENKINDILVQLDMKNAKIKILFEELLEYNQDGKDKIVFLIKTNKGEEYKQLSKISSGGEMSRIMLAIKSQIAKKDNLSIIIFDEIDTGISRAASNAVSDLMSDIGKSIQVIAISHLPNIAAKADTNFYISKYEKDERTFSKIEKLSENDVLKEIARIAGGNVSDTSIEYAKELRYRGNKSDK